MRKKKLLTLAQQRAWQLFVIAGATQNLKNFRGMSVPSSGILEVILLDLRRLDQQIRFEHQ